MNRDEHLEMEQRQLSSTLRSLERSLELDSVEEARMEIGRWNLSQRAQDRVPDFGLDYIAGVVRNKGLRLPALEEAMKVGRVMVKGDLQLNRGFLRALTGQAPLKVESCSVRLEIHF